MAKLGKERTHHKKKVKPTPKIENGKNNENMQVWRKKEESRTLDCHYAFNAHVISPKAQRRYSTLGGVVH